MSNEATLEVGAVVEGIVKGITRFGAFVELPNGQTGLVHISEVANTFVNDINQFLKQEDKVRVKVLFLDGKKIGLSIKQADPAYRQQRPDDRRPAGGGRMEGRGRPRSLEDMLSKFMRDSEDKQSTLRRRQLGRGGTGGGGGGKGGGGGREG